MNFNFLEPMERTRAKRFKKNVKIFVVSLPRFVDRRASIHKQLTELGLDFEFVDDFDGSKLETKHLNMYNSSASIRANGRDLTRAEIGNAMSHISIYEKIIKEGFEEAIIFEDDTVILDNFLEILTNWGKIPKDWEVVQFCHSGQRMQFWRRWNKPTIFEKYYCASFRGEIALASAYAINRRGAQKLLAYAYPVRLSSDGLLGRFQDTGINSYGIFPVCCIQSNEFRSTLDPSRFAPK